jgi:hypothetical protein
MITDMEKSGFHFGMVSFHLHFFSVGSSEAGFLLGYNQFTINHFIASELFVSFVRLRLIHILQKEKGGGNERSYCRPRLSSECL